MRFLMLAGLFGSSICLAGGAQPAALWDIYRQLYPNDPAQRQALDECFMRDPAFNRLDPEARTACYRHGAVAHAPQPQQGNFVDLWRAAGQGHMPQDDIRYQEQNQAYLHPHAH